MKQGCPLENRVRELTADEVRRDFIAEYETLGYESTKDVLPFEGFIGLERAESAAIDGLEMQRPGWNIFLRYGTSGRHSFVDTILEEHGKKPGSLKDICLVHSFEPEKCDSTVLYLEPGKAKQLKQDVASLIKMLQEEVPLLTQSQQYVEFDQKLRLADVDDTQALMDRLKSIGLALGQSQYGTPVVYALNKDDPDSGRKEMKGAEIVSSYLRGKIKADQDAASAKKRLLVELASADIGKMVAEMKAKYGADEVSSWLDRVGKDVLANLDSFLMADQSSGRDISQMRRENRTDLLLEPRFRRYEINVQVDNSETPTDRPLVINEEKPTRSKLGGKRKVYSTSLTTEMEFDHMSVDLGSLVKAKGGYFVVDIEDLLVKHGSWDVLKNILDAGELKLGETFMGFLGFEVEAPKIDGIDISDVKVILVGEQLLDHYIQSYPLENKFLRERFKINVDFEPDTKADDNDGENIAKVAGFVRKICDKEGLLHFDRTGLSAAAEHLVRMAGSKEKFSLRLGGAGGLSDVMAEADAIARKAGVEYVTAEHFQDALDRRHRRIAATEDRYREFTLEKLATVNLEGEKVGHAHALSVYTLSDLMFCVPTKATAVTSTGKDGVIDVMEEVHLAGEIYQFGMEELKGYIDHVFGQGPAVAFKGRIVKEEAYGGIDGNSSSALNTVVLLSRLSGVPIIQRRAMTGGISTTGQVVPIGAETVKVEGFYEACKASGMLEKYDDCGVVIPAKNTIGLQLKPEVVEAISEGKFHVWEVSRVEDAVELLTRAEPGAVHDEVADTVTITRDKNSVYAKAAKKLGHYTKMAKK